MTRERQERRLEEQRQRLEQLQRQPALESRPESARQADKTCFTIDRIEIEGTTQLTEEARERLLAPFLHRCIGTAGIDEILRALTDHYLDRGFVTSRAYVPEQDLSRGTLKIIIIEGLLEGLDAAAQSRLTPRELAMSFPGETGQLLNLREIEQALDQLNRLPSNRATVELRPGSTPGTSRAEISNTPQTPWRVRLSRNNDGQKSTGHQQIGLGIEWDSPLGLADTLSLHAGRNLYRNSTREARNGGLAYSIPWGWWTASWNFNYSDYQSNIPGAWLDFKTSGNSRAHDLRIERVVQRDNIGKSALSVGVNVTENKNYIENIKLDVSSKRLAELGLGINHGRRIGTGFINLDLGWQRGMGALGAEHDQHPERDEAHANYNKYTATTSVLQPITLASQTLSLESMAYWQKSEDVLYSPRRVSVGGQSSVRGFHDQSLSGDSGGYWRTQLRWNLPPPAWLQPNFNGASLALARDVGVIERDRNNRASGQHGRLSGQALELNIRSRYLQASTTLARTEKRPRAIARNETPFHFRVDFIF